MRPGRSVRLAAVVAGAGLVAAALPAATASTGGGVRIHVSVNRTSIPATGVIQPRPHHLTIHDPRHQVRRHYVVDPARPRVTARVRNASGDPVRDANVVFHATRGVHFGTVHEHAHGRYTAALISSTRPGRVRVWATIGSTSSNHARMRQSFGALHTEGSRVLDATGHGVRLRGVNFQPYVPNDYLSNGFPPRKVYEALRNRWHVNVVRAFVDLDQWQRSCPITRNNHGYDRHYRPAYRSFIRALTERGVYVILVLGSAPRVSCGHSGHFEMPARISSNRRADGVRFWHDVAKTFKTNPLVGFDLYNEPNHVPNGPWLNGGRLSQSTTWHAAGMQSMYNAVRFTGASNLVFVEGPAYAVRTPPFVMSSLASKTRGHDAPPRNLVYAAHFYTCFHHDWKYPGDGAHGPYKCNGGTTPPAPDAGCPSGTDVPQWADPARRLDAWVAWRDAHNAPIIEDEFGWPGNTNPVDKCFVKRTIAYDERHAIPWVAFQWVLWRSHLWSLVRHPGRGNYRPTISGCPVYRALTGARGCG